MEQYDLLIAGGGPAGSVLAKTAGKRMKVLIAEARDCHLPIGSAREKSCGGMLNLSAQKALAALSLPLPGEVLQSPQVFAVRAIDFDTNQERYYQKQYVNINREAFERWLLAEALMSRGVELEDRTQVTEFTPYDEWVEVTLRSADGGSRKVRTKFLAGADGGASLVRRRLEERYSGPDEPRYPIRRYASLQQWFEIGEELPYYAAFFDQRVTDYYSWMIPKGTRVILGTAISEGKNVRGRFQYLKRRVNASGFDLREPVREQGAVLLRPYGPGSVHLGKGRVFLAGEAAGLISSSSEEGISYALNSGAALGEALLSSHKSAEIEEAYRRKVKKLSWGLGVKSAKALIMYQPALRGAVFKSGALSMNVRG